MSTTRYCQAGHKFEIEGEMEPGNTITVHVTPAEGYTFNGWSDGNTNNPRTIQIDECGVTYTAKFSGSSPSPDPPTPTEKYTVTVTPNPSSGGTVTGGGQYDDGASATIRATANSGYTFTNWTNGSQVVTTNPVYTFTVVSDASFTANFASAGPTQTTYYWKSSNNINDLRVPISNYNQGTYTSTPTSVTAGAEGTATGFGRYTAFVVPTGKSVRGV